MARIEELREKHAEAAEFVYVYIKEAHPDDEWQMDANLEKDVVFEQPTSDAKRLEIARTFVEKMDVGTTTLVDDIRNTANACYAAWPERIYIIETDGTIAYKGGTGPFYFEPEDIDRYLNDRRQTG